MEDNLQKALDAELPKGYSHNLQGKDYIAGYIAIEQANRIFGYDNWGYKITRNPELLKETDLTGNPYLYYIAQVETWVRIGNILVRREDVGYGEVTYTKPYSDQKTGKPAGGRPQLEVALKGAVTDALKRALRAYGNQFGNSLYDREDKLPNIQATISTAEEQALAPQIQKILTATSQDDLDEVLEELVQLSKQEDWNEAQLNYIRKIATRAKAGIDARAKRVAGKAKA